MIPIILSQTQEVQWEFFSLAIGSFRNVLIFWAGSHMVSTIYGLYHFDNRIWHLGTVSPLEALLI